MKTKSMMIHFLTLVMVIAAVTACAPTPIRESTGEYVDDTVITTKAKSLLAADDFLKSFQISVETFKGVVQLSGFVDSRQTADKAVQVVRGIQGVKSVENHMIIK